MAKDKWVKISDDRVNNIWVCPDCKVVTRVKPYFYEQAGTPVCTQCDTDMEYHYTEINKKEK